MDLKGQIALVTGGSRGIGRAVALELGRSGAAVMINYRENQAAAAAALKELLAQGGSGQICPFDVAEEEQVEEAVKKIVDQHKKIDILVNNAGITADNLLVRLKSQDWDRVLGVNLKGTVHCTKAVCRSMIRERYGRIVNMTSVVGQTGNAGQSAYAASKAGMIGFTKAMARELAARGITVNAVAPGYIETEMTAKLGEKIKEEFLHSIPAGRFGSCEDVAQAVSFLVGPGAGYITGQVINVNGGLLM
ncbi:MAG: 3-oxoacyl-[acyl-carrier-protein] reductase [Deltaproteobacteria bacterium]|nr:3-oxoacyl-[acyl-carrier-protein] reductase [Deltaproteobacteria bacterium]MBI2540190.1 3-oxoacyl-[acyl-carrier-protein] reductase [Deltaproteobacteria bacterium]MBI2991644.1 3-oxoacyl-[acyl-carrier-protein] reductase [Deltaproteobacteria bacterium]